MWGGGLLCHSGCAGRVIDFSIELLHAEGDEMEIETDAMADFRQDGGQGGRRRLINNHRAALRGIAAVSTCLDNFFAGILGN